MIQNFMGQVGTSDVLYLVLAFLAPLGGALATRKPSAWTGIATTVLTAAIAFVTEWYQSADASHYDWGKALTNTVVGVILAFLAHEKVWKGGTLEAKAHATPHGPAPANPPTTT